MQEDPEERVRKDAALALGKLGAEGILALINALNSPAEHVKVAAASALISLGIELVSDLWSAIREGRDGELRTVYEEIVRLMEQREKWHYKTTALAFRVIGPEAKRVWVIPTLIAALEDPKREVRLAAAQILAALGPEAKEAVPALIIALKDPDANVREVAADALGEILKREKDREESP